MAALRALLNVRDMDKSARFYMDLGFTVTRIVKDEQGTPYLTTLSFEGALVHLSAIAANDDPDFRKWVESGLGAGAVLGVAVEDVNAVFMKVSGKSDVHLETPITESPFGRLFTVHDPDGYVLMFIEEREPQGAAQG